MGVYLNPGNQGFLNAIRSEIYLDKTGLIAYTNKCLNTKEQFICVSRPRRFGKSMTLDMLAAYYSRDCDSKELFKGLAIEQIKDRNNLQALDGYSGELLLIGVNYDKDKTDKPHSCMIERVEKL